MAGGLDIVGELAAVPGVSLPSGGPENVTERKRRHLCPKGNGAEIESKSADMHASRRRAGVYVDYTSWSRAHRRN